MNISVVTVSVEVEEADLPRKISQFKEKGQVPASVRIDVVLGTSVYKFSAVRIIPESIEIVRREKEIVEVSFEGEVVIRKVTNRHLFFWTKDGSQERPNKYAWRMTKLMWSET